MSGRTSTAVTTSGGAVIEDSQVPEGGPLLVMPETYGGAEADNERDDNESADEETQVESSANGTSANGQQCKKKLSVSELTYIMQQ